MPLLDSDAHSILAESLNSLDELLERVVALGVKFAVLEELIHGLLLPTGEHLLQEAEGHLGDQKLVVVAVVPGHLGTFTADVLHAVVVGAVQVLKFSLEVVSLIRELLSDTPDVLNLCIVMQGCTVEISDLLL